MNKETLTYFADKLMEDIRNDSFFSEQLLADMNSFPLVDCLREKVLDSDKTIIIGLIDSPDLSRCYLGLNLVNKIQHIESVQSELISFWDATENYERKYFLMWPLLNNSNLAQERHKEIYLFILENWERWKIDYIKFAGRNFLRFSEARFYDTNFPESKKWVYLLSIKCLENRTDIQVALSKFISDETNEMQQTVLQFLKN